MQHMTISKVALSVCELFLLLLSEGCDGLFSPYVRLAEKWVQWKSQEGVQPTQACPVHSPRLSDVKQICQPHSRVNAPPLVRHQIPTGPGYFQKHKLSNSQQFCYGKENLPPSFPSPPTALTGGQAEREKCSKTEEGHVGMFSGTGATAWKHTPVYVKWRQKEARGHTETKDQQSGSKYGNVREMDQKGVNWQERDRKCLEDWQHGPGDIQAPGTHGNIRNWAQTHTQSTTHWNKHKWQITDSIGWEKTSGASSRPLLHIVADLITPKPSLTDGWLIPPLNISHAGGSIACLGSLLCHQTVPRVIKFSPIFFN